MQVCSAEPQTVQLCNARIVLVTLLRMQQMQATRLDVMTHSTRFLVTSSLLANSTLSQRLLALTLG